MPVGGDSPEHIPVDRVRNFCIVAHIDHGKSTLADRILELTGTVSAREMVAQYLDNMDIERERGITIKARAVRARWPYRGPKGGGLYQFNLIDTPGHVDFTYEVSRSLKACDGAILLIDATQGVEAQTLSNAYLAIDEALEIIPVLNKVDLPHADSERVKREAMEIFGFKEGEFFSVSAKSGLGVRELLDGLVERLPAPKIETDQRLKALLFDAEYNDYRGVITYLKVVSGMLKPGDHLFMMGTQRRLEAIEVGVFAPNMVRVDRLEAGDVGYLISNVKELAAVRIGDTVAHWGSGVEAMPGYRDPQKMVYCGFYPANDVEFEVLKKGMDRLHLNDSSFSYHVESSTALSFGFRCGFMGLLHMDVIRERLERESGVTIIQTAPNVNYQVLCTDGSTMEIHNPADMPDPARIEEIREPFVIATIITPADYIGSVMKLSEERRGVYMKTQYLSPQRVLLEYRLPFNEVVFDFFDRLKSSTKGYATLDYQMVGFEAGDLVKMDIMVHGEPVDALSAILHRSKSQARGREIVQKLREEIPRHQFQIPLQACIGAKVIARENISAVRKNVTAKCYGGDITRKRKLLEKQKEGKKRMKSIGSVNVPQEAFMAVLSIQKQSGD